MHVVLFRGRCFPIGEDCTVPEAQVKLAYDEGKQFVTGVLDDKKYGPHYITVGTPIMNGKGEIISYLSIDISTETLDGIKETVINSNIVLLVLSGLFVIIVIISFFLLQKWYQKEVGTTENTYQKEIKTLIASVSKVKPREMSFLNRFGILGEYLKLEVKSIQRNKTVRKQFWSGFIAMALEKVSKDVYSFSKP